MNDVSISITITYAWDTFEFLPMLGDAKVAIQVILLWVQKGTGRYGYVSPCVP